MGVCVSKKSEEGRRPAAAVVSDVPMAVEPKSPVMAETVKSPSASDVKQVMESTTAIIENAVTEEAKAAEIIDAGKTIDAEDDETANEPPAETDPVIDETPAPVKEEPVPAVVEDDKAADDNTEEESKSSSVEEESSADGQAEVEDKDETTVSKSYDESWIPDEHLQQTRERSRSASSAGRRKKGGKKKGRKHK